MKEEIANQFNINRFIQPSLPSPALIARDQEMYALYNKRMQWDVAFGHAPDAGRYDAQ